MKNISAARWYSYLLLLIAYYTVKFGSPYWIEAQVSQQHFTFLNFITGQTTNQPLHFYLGQAKNIFFGPIHMVLAATLFCLIAWRYLKDAGLVKMTAAFFLFLLFTKFEVLFWPPYGESASGPWVEAIWLARHHFDYLGLARQPSYLAGGPRVYFSSLYPTYIALLMKLIPNTRLFLLINHMLVFGMGALILSLFREIVAVCSNKENALWASVLFCGLPLFQSQVEQLNMEIPVLTFAMLATYFLVQKRLWIASVFIVIAALFKGVAVSLCAAFFAIGVLIFLFDKQYRFKPAVLGAGLLALSAFLIKLTLSYLMLQKDGRGFAVGFLKGWPVIIHTLTFYIFCASTLYLIVRLLFARLKEKRSCSEIFQEYFVPIVMLVFALGWFALFVNSRGLHARYWLLLTPYTLFGVIYVLLDFIKQERILRMLSIITVLGAFFASYGFMAPEVVEYSFTGFERSLEYRNNLINHLNLVRSLDEKYREFTIGAPFTFAHSLYLPELGYTDKKFDVMMYQFPCTYGIPTFRNLQEMDLKKTVWVGITDLPTLVVADIPYPVGPRDVVLEKLVYGEREISLFVGGESIQKIRLYRYMMLKQFQQMESHVYENDGS